MSKYALAIVRFSKTDDLKEVEVNFEIVERLLCPADGTTLRTICTLFGNHGMQRMRLGACDDCGYIGYMDYPKEQWIRKFYHSEWLRTTEKDLATEVNLRKLMSKKQINEDRAMRTVKLERFLARHALSVNKPVFEIGCGYGQTLAYFKELGYEVMGCETSAFRAKCARMAYGLSVSNVPFEDANFQRRLASLRFGLIFSHHVLEHVFDPMGMIRLSSKLQSVGDYIIVGVPDVYTEPSFMTLFYLPHPNAFSKQSLTNLLAINGYEVVDDFSDQEELYIVGRRVRSPYKIAKIKKHYLFRSLGKFTTALGLRKKYITAFRRLWCYRRLGFDYGGQVMHFEFAERIMGNWYLILAHKLLMLYLFYKYSHLEAYISCIVKDVPFRYSSYKESPIEIQFEKNIILLTK